MEPANASDRKSIRRQEKEAALRDRQRREVITEIMSTRPGRSWLWDTLASCSIFATTHSPDASIAAFSEGRRSVGLALLSDILASCPDQFILAMREHNERHSSNDRSPTNPASDDPASKRPIGAQPDGGDFGAEPDQALDADDPDSRYASPGRDIYVDHSKA